MDQYRFAGHRVVQFPPATKTALKEVAERLIDHRDEIVGQWIEMQFKVWQPPGQSPGDLRMLFGGLLDLILHGMQSGQLEECVALLEVEGSKLAQRSFPFEALTISLHFLEESYMHLLLEPRSERTQQWLISMDEFLHVVIAALATSYFQHNREQLLADAGVGQVVQEALFPRPPKTIGDLDLGYDYKSATDKTKIGGDFLDVFQCGDQTAFLIGDMSGHGVDAAVDSATIRSMFRGFLRDGAGLAEALAKLNRVLIEELESNQFATALAGVYTTPGRLRLVSAGHPTPIVCGTGSEVEECHSFPLAVNEKALYEEVLIDLDPGDVFVAFTDGVTEARGSNGMFGEEGVRLAVEEKRHDAARAIADEVSYQALRHAGGRLRDDLAILVLKRSRN